MCQFNARTGGWLAGHCHDNLPLFPWQCERASNKLLQTVGRSFSRRVSNVSSAVLLSVRFRERDPNDGDSDKCGLNLCS